MDLVDRDGSRPIKRWREIDAQSGLELPPADQRNGQCCTCGRDEQRGRNVRSARQLAPQEPANTQGSEDDSDVHRQAASAYPLRQRHLCRQAQRGNRADPANSAEQAGGKRSCGMAGQREQERRGRGARRAPSHQLVCPPSLLQSGQYERATDGACTDRGQQASVESRTCGLLCPGNERKQSPVGAREHEEGRGTHKRRAEMRVVSGMTQSEHDRATEGFGWQVGRAFWPISPGKQCRDDARVAEGVDPEWWSVAKRADQQSSQCRAYGPADIDSQAVQRYGRREVRTGNQLTYYGLPRGCADRGRRADERRHDEQACGSNEMARHE